MYARANVAYYVGLPTPYPYEWSLMVRAVPGARPQREIFVVHRKRPPRLVAELVGLLTPDRTD